MYSFLKQITATTTVLALLMSPLIALIPTQPAQAAFPGLNGRIVYSSNETGNFEIYTIKSDGTDKINITNNPATDTRPTFSPDGTKIAFNSDRDGNQEIYIVNTDGTNIIRVTNTATADVDPAFSPDGTKLAHRDNRDGNNEIYIINLDGSNPINLTNHSNVDEEPSWSPDDSKILFRTSRDGNREIYVMDTDGSNQVNLTNNPTVDESPSWSPDGSKIAFVSNREDSNQEIYTMNANGTAVTRITNESFPVPDTNPVWSPDGTKIIFNSTRDGIQDAYISNSDGSDVVRINSDGTLKAIPDWQPLTIPPATLDSSVVLDATDGEAVTYDPVSNHTDTYESIDPTSVTITTEPQKGTAEVNNTTGEITYTPDSNQQANTGSSFSFLAFLDNLLFTPAHAQSTNQDSFTYSICSTANEDLCTDNTVAVNLADATNAQGQESSGSLANTGTNLTSLVIASAVITLIGMALWVTRKRVLYG